MADITGLSDTEKAVVDAFHQLYYPFFRDTKWLGISAQKCPFDLFVYQELIFQLRPDLIIECGTAEGGSAVFLASICELVGHGEIVTIDVQPAGPSCPRVTYWEGGSLSHQTISRVEELITDKHSVMVILDDDHTRDHVLEELRTYARFVTPGSYLVLEDTNINGHPVYPEFGPGPMEALSCFLKENNDFDVDRSREKFLVSFNPRGFLRKRGSTQPPVMNTLCGFLATDKDALIFSQKKQLEKLERELAARSAVFESVLNSKGWRLLNTLRTARSRFKTLVGR